MRFVLIILFLIAGFSSSGQKAKCCDASYDFVLNYRPATVTLLSSSDSSSSHVVNNTREITYLDIKPGYYKIRVSGRGQRTTFQDSVVVAEGQNLVLSFKIEGPCLFDHPATYIPICPENHKDGIVPIIYGLIATRGDTFIKSKKEMTVKYGGCVTTGCDPQFYCKQHDIEF